MSTISQPLFKWMVYFPAVQLKGSNVFGRLTKLLQSQNTKLDDLNNHQLDALIKIINYARQHVPAYKHLPAISSLDELSTLPTISKADVRNAPESFKSDETFRFLTTKTTGGSTGIPMSFAKTPLAREYYLAAMWRGYSWAGIEIGAKRAQFWGTPLSKNRYMEIADRINHRQRFSAFAFDDNDLETYTQRILRFRPDFFYGYASMLAEYALYFERKGQTPPFNISSIVSTSEILTPERRNAIERVFGTKVFNEYGCGEIGTIAHECEHGSMHLNMENIVVEIVDDNGQPVPNDIPGNIVVTELYNKVMPLIRYKLGDIGTITNKKCSCGRQLPVFEGPVGREMDQLVTASGKKFGGIYYVYKMIMESKKRNLGIERFQLQQHSTLSFTFKMVTNNNFSKETYDFLTSEIKKDFGEEAYVRFDFVTEIPRAKSGKTQIVIGMEQAQN